MSDYIKIIQSHDHIIETYELVKEWEVWIRHNHIGGQAITIRILLGNDGKYHYRTSHYYHGTGQAGPYVSSDSYAPTIESAINKALRQLFSFYNQEDEGAMWVKAEF